MTWRDDDFEELGAELRRRVGEDFVREAAELEQLTALQRRRRESQAEAARRAMHRGDRVVIDCRLGHWTGVLTSVGEDYVSLATGEALVEAYLPGVILEVATARSGGQSGVPASATWRARLAELEMNREEVTLLAPLLGFEGLGKIEVVASDHLEFVGQEQRRIIPLDLVTVIIKSRG
jgi:hypothetical protein